jgi:hypothetical protein
MIQVLEYRDCKRDRRRRGGDVELDVHGPGRLVVPAPDVTVGRRIRSGGSRSGSPTCRCVPHAGRWP